MALTGNIVAPALEPTPLLAAFARRYPFALDAFQIEASVALDDGRSVLVAAPTGTGKTLVAEYAVYRALARGQRIFYTTPIKALSNQKYRDFRAQYGDAAGLLTGDVVISPTARAAVDLETGAVEVGRHGGQIVVMTTEVLRNMLLQDAAAMRDVGCVVFDEIHYMADPMRGTTWEESIICCPRDVQFVCLSATVANAAEIASWISDVHGETQLVFHDERAVPLEHHYFIDNEPVLAVDADGRRVTRFTNVGGEARHGIRRRGFDWIDGPPRKARREAPPEEIVLGLRQRNLLPAIYFLFSRRETESSAEACSRLRLTSPAERRTIAARVTEKLDHLAPEDRRLGQVEALTRLLPIGVAFHHAGLLPVLKQLVEELFADGLIGVVFATDTLALGINMPARTVVIGEFSKFDGESRRLLTTNEYRQLTGRAGRRGIDEHGTAVVPYSPWVPADDVFGIATGPLLPVESAFLVRYNTVLNLWTAEEGGEPGERLVGLIANSLREYQLDGQLRDLRAESIELAAAIAAFDLNCPRCTVEGLAEYETLRRALPRARKSEEKARRAEEFLRNDLDARPWQPTKSQVRFALRTFSGGEPIHTPAYNWGAFLRRPTEAEGVALVLFGDEVRTIKSYAEVDYLAPAAGRVDLTDLTPPPSSAVEEGAGGEIDVSSLSPNERREITRRLRALDLPNLAELAASHRARLERELAGPLARAGAQVAEAAAERTSTEARIAAHPSHGCQNRHAHREALQTLDDARERRGEIVDRIGRLGHVRRSRTRQTLRSIQRVLERFGHLRRGEVTSRGRALADVFDTNGLILCEAIELGVFKGLSAPELAETLSWFAYDRDQAFPNRCGLPRRALEARDRLADVEAAVLRAEMEVGLRLSTGFNRNFYGLAHAWCQGESFEEILSRVTLAEGDVMLTFSKTLDLMRQLRDMLRKSSPSDALLVKLAEAERLMRRGIVEQCTRLVGENARPASGLKVG